MSKSSDPWKSYSWKKYSWRTYLADYWELLEGKRFWFVFFTVLKAISNLTPFAITYLLGLIVDFFTVYHAGDSLTKIYWLVGGIALLGSLQVWLRYSSKVRMQNIGAEVRKEARLKAMSQLINLELKWHEQEETGSKMQKINEGGEEIYKGIKDFSNEGVSIITSLIAAIIIFLVLDWKYAVYGLIFLMLYLYAEYLFNKKLVFWYDKLNKIKEKVSGKFHESASNLMTIKSLGLGENIQKNASHYEKRYYEIWFKARKVNENRGRTVKIFAALAYAGFALLVCFDVAAATITIGAILIYTTYFAKLKDALDDLTTTKSTFIATKSAVGRFMIIYHAASGLEQDGDLKIPTRWNRIEFKNVNFNYRNEAVLKNFNLVIERGTVLGIVGRSGCGKSTLVKLLLRLYKPQTGEILIDGVNLNKFRNSSITDNFSVVLQDSEVFNLSVLENITISTLKKDQHRLQQALNIAQLQPVLKKLPRGLDTLLGEKGYKLSGGERQRVGLARAVYKNSPLLLLDEATSALDSKTESLIQKKLQNYLPGKTLLIVAHRLSTLRNVQQIIMMENGKIIERGSFTELLNKKGQFFELYRLQNKENVL